MEAIFLLANPQLLLLRFYTQSKMETALLQAFIVALNLLILMFSLFSKSPAPQGSQELPGRLVHQLIRTTYLSYSEILLLPFVMLSITPIIREYHNPVNFYLVFIIGSCILSLALILINASLQTMFFSFSLSFPEKNILQSHKHSMKLFASLSKSLAAIIFSVELEGGAT